MLNVVDEFTHECLTIRVARRLKTVDVVDVLADPFILRGVPEHGRSDNGPEFIAEVVKDWITAVGARTAYITPAVRGRAASWRASTPGHATNCSAESSSTRWRKPKSASNVGAEAHPELAIHMDHSVGADQKDRIYYDEIGRGRWLHKFRSGHLRLV
jgi:hypothetical protein